MHKWRVVLDLQYVEEVEEVCLLEEVAGLDYDTEGVHERSLHLRRLDVLHTLLFLGPHWQRLSPLEVVKQYIICVGLLLIDLAALNFPLP